MSVTFQAPAGVTQGSTVILRDGSSVTVDANGNVTVPANATVGLIDAGFLITGSSLATSAGIAFSQIAKMLANRVLTSAALALGSTNTRIANGACDYQIGAAAGGVNTYKKCAAVAAGTILPVGTIPINTWGIYLVSTNAADSKTVTAGAANYTTGYATEAAAIAALPATPSTDAPLGYVTVQTHTGTTFVAGTDALTAGTGGNVANATNYYNAGLAY